MLQWNLKFFQDTEVRKSKLGKVLQQKGRRPRLCNIFSLQVRTIIQTKYQCSGVLLLQKQGYSKLCKSTYVDRSYKGRQQVKQTSVGFIYTFWFSLSPTSSIVEQGVLVNSSFANDQFRAISTTFQHHFKICLLWFLHEKECSFYTHLFYCTEIR